MMETERRKEPALMNPYLKNLHRIEFAVTNACTGRCIHCQNGESPHTRVHIDPSAAVKAVRQISEHYHVTSLMTFGGEPLLYPEIVCEIQKTAADRNIAKRQIITNGYFSNDLRRIETVTRMIRESGVNDLLLSADAFHQETIPLEPVIHFARCAVKEGIPVRLSPAWLVSLEDDNPYNLKTKEIIQAFENIHIPVGKGNIIYPSGNALKYLREYFGENIPASSPYEEDPKDIRTVSFAADGSVLNGNIYQADILEIIQAYRPSSK